MRLRHLILTVVVLASLAVGTAETIALVGAPQPRAEQNAAIAQYGSPSTKPKTSCTPKKAFTLTLYKGRSPVLSAVVTVNGKRVKTTKNGRKATLKLKRTKTPVTVKVVVQLLNGKLVTFTKRYASCAH